MYKYGLHGIMYTAYTAHARLPHIFVLLAENSG